MPTSPFSRRTLPSSWHAGVSRCECQAFNAAGRLLADLASSINGILGTGRVCGDNGQASYVGLPGQEVASWPDHILMPSAFFRLAEFSS